MLLEHGTDCRSSLPAWRRLPYVEVVTTVDINNANKHLVQQIFSELSQGNSQPLVAAMAPDVSWTVPGTTSWSGRYEGRDAVQQDLLGPLVAQFADQYTSHPSRFVAEGDLVVVETEGRVTTKRGLPYDNVYCFVIRLGDGMIREIVEYCDTALVATALEPLDPARRPGRLMG